MLNIPRIVIGVACTNEAGLRIGAEGRLQIGRLDPAAQRVAAVFGAHGGGVLKHQGGAVELPHQLGVGHELPARLMLGKSAQALGAAHPHGRVLSAQLFRRRLPALQVALTARCRVHHALQVGDLAEAFGWISALVLPQAVLRRGGLGFGHPAGEQAGRQFAQFKLNKLLLHRHLSAQMPQRHFACGEAAAGVGEQPAATSGFGILGEFGHQTPGQAPPTVRGQDAEGDKGRVGVLLQRQLGGGLRHHLAVFPHDQQLPLNVARWAAQLRYERFSVQRRVFWQPLSPDGLAVAGNGLPGGVRRGRIHSFKV